MAAAPRRFRAAQREMAVAQEIISTVPAFRIDGDADTDPDTMLPRASHERYFEGAGDPFGELCDRLVRFYAIERDGKFVAAEPGDDRVAICLGLQPRSHRP